MDYLLSDDVDNNCVTSSNKMFMNGTFKRLRGSTSVYVKNSAMEEKKGMVTKPSADFDGEIREFLTAHLQYEEDEALFRENVLATESNRVYCKIKQKWTLYTLGNGPIKWSSGRETARTTGLPIYPNIDGDDSQLRTTDIAWYHTLCVYGLRITLCLMITYTGSKTTHGRLSSQTWSWLTKLSSNISI